MVRDMLGIRALSTYLCKKYHVFYLFFLFWWMGWYDLIRYTLEKWISWKIITVPYHMTSATKAKQSNKADKIFGIWRRLKEWWCCISFFATSFYYRSFFWHESDYNVWKARTVNSPPLWKDQYLQAGKGINRQHI